MKFGANELVKKIFTRREFYITGLALGIAIIFCVVTVYYWTYINHLQSYGYLGAFIISLFASSILIMPIPYVAVVFTLGGVLNPAFVGAASGLGASIGASSIYLTGYRGHNLFQNINDILYSRLVNWARRKGSVVVFIMSAVFNPLFVPMTATMGILRFRFWKFFLMCWAGNTVKSLVIAYGGYLGLGSLLRLIGIGL